MRTTRLSRLAVLPALGFALLLGASGCDSGGDRKPKADDATGAAETLSPTVNPEAGTAAPPKSEPTVFLPVATGKAGEGKGGSGSGRPPAPATGPATVPSLTAALLTQAELPGGGFRVDGPDRAKGVAPSPVAPTVDRAACAVFAQVAAFDAGAPEAWAHREYVDAAKPAATRLGITLAGHRDDRGAALLADIDRAMAGCAADFVVNAGTSGTPGTPSGPEQWSVAPVDGAPLAGDETVAYRVTARSAAGTRVETVVFVRFGPTTAQFVYAGDAAPDSAPYAAFITGQVQKARALLGR